MDAVIIARGPQILIVQRDDWHQYYYLEKPKLEVAVGALLLVFEHVGSTAISGTGRKARVDILAATQTLQNASAIAAKLQMIGYVQRPFIPVGPAIALDPASRAPERLFFQKRTTQTPEGVDLSHPGYNIHVVSLEHFYQDEQLLFRDYLRAHREVVAEYARLKCDVVQRIASYSEYVPAKADFIQRVLASARAARDAGDSH